MTNPFHGVLKVNVRRDPAPVGIPARCFLVCPCAGLEITLPSVSESVWVTCPNCGTQYDGRGWIRALGPRVSVLDP